MKSENSFKLQIFSNLKFIFALSLARGRAFEPQEIFSVFFSFNGIKKHVILPPLPRILSVLSRSASVSYAGSSGSDTMPLICDLHFVKTFIQVCNLEKVTFGQK